MSGRIMRRTTTFRAYSTPKCSIAHRRGFGTKWFGNEDYGKSENGLDGEEQELFDEDIYEKYSSIHNHNGHDPSYPRRDLPLSPLMDPKYQAAKGKYQKPKPPPPAVLTPFQERLGRNPYAQALSTPLRMCALTRVRLPSFFLIPFELLRHPDTGETWYLPRSLYSSTSPSSKVSLEEAEEAAATRRDRRGPRTYTLSREALLAATMTLGSGFTRGWKKFLPPHAEAWRIAPSATKIRWRADIDEFVLGVLRERLVRELGVLCEAHKGYVVACEEGWKEVRVGGKKQLGAVLWLGDVRDDDDTDVAALTPNSGEEEAAAEDLSEGKQELPPEVNNELEELEKNKGPTEFAVMERKEGLKTKLPVYNLQALVGKKYIKELRALKPDIFGWELAAIKHRGRTLDVQMQLWKLQGYIAKFEDHV